MNTTKIFKTGLAFGSLLFVFSSCEKQLEIAPRQSIEATTALTSKMPLMLLLLLFMLLINLYVYMEEI